MATPPIILTDAPDVPDRSNRSTFSASAIGWDVFTKVTSIPEFRLLMTNVWSNAVDAYNSAVAAFTSAGNAAASEAAAAASAAVATGAANAPLWVTGTTYTLGFRVISPATGRLYRRTVAGAGTTDPSLDPTNWSVVSNGLAYAAVAGTSITAQAGNQYALTNVAASTVTAPAAPSPGDTFQVAVCNALTANVVNWAGLKQENLSDATTTLDVVRVWTFTYINAAYGWRIY